MKTVLVTGGSRGIGKSISTTLAKSHHVVVGYVNSQDKAEEVVNEIAESGGSANSVEINISSKESVDRAFATIEGEYGSVDILINNAGITGPTAPLWEYDIEMWNKIVQINLMGTFNCCRAIVPNMIENNYGRIVNVASVAGKDGNANASAYSSGKAGAIGLTKSLGKELADKNIAVNAVTPRWCKN